MAAPFFAAASGVGFTPAWSAEPGELFIEGGAFGGEILVDDADLVVEVPCPLPVGGVVGWLGGAGRARWWVSVNIVNINFLTLTVESRGFPGSVNIVKVVKVIF